jgi:hypothetical protein
MSDISDYYLKEEPEFICGIKVPSITEWYVDNHPSVVDRFFTRFYRPKPGRTDEDHLVLFHSNRICLVGLAPTHIAFKKGIKSINYDIGNLDRSKNEVKGKGKKGGMILQPTSCLALVKCLDDSEYKVDSCITGKLIETNSRLDGNIEKLSVEGDGYVAIILPKPEHCDALKTSLLTEEQYAEH